MSTEKQHHREYANNNVTRKSIITKNIVSDDFDYDLDAHTSVKLKSEKTIKATKFRTASAHAGRAAQKRKIVNGKTVHFINDAKCRNHRGN